MRGFVWLGVRSTRCIQRSLDAESQLGLTFSRYSCLGKDLGDPGGIVDPEASLDLGTIGR